jgi:hypothetical protein
LKTLTRLALLWWTSIALLVILGLLIYLEQNFAGDSYTHAGEMIYPVFMHVYGGAYPGTEALIALIGLGGLFISIYKKLNQKTLITTFVLAFSATCIFVFAWTFAISTSAPEGGRNKLNQLDKTTFENHVYYLIADPCYKPDSVCPPVSYQVFRCDQNGFICQLYDIPFEETSFLKTIAKANFVIDVMNGKLYLQIESQKYPIVAKASFSTKPRS